jgi:hypothetical protein
MSMVYTTATHVRRANPLGSRTGRRVDGVIPGEDSWS